MADNRTHSETKWHKSIKNLSIIHLIWRRLLCGVMTIAIVHTIHACIRSFMLLALKSNVESTKDFIFPLCQSFLLLLEFQHTLLSYPRIVNGMRFSGYLICNPIEDGNTHSLLNWMRYICLALCWNWDYSHRYGVNWIRFLWIPIYIRIEIFTISLSAVLREPADWGKTKRTVASWPKISFLLCVRMWPAWHCWFCTSNERRDRIVNRPLPVRRFVLSFGSQKKAERKWFAFTKNS